MVEYPFLVMPANANAQRERALKGNSKERPCFILCTQLILSLKSYFWIFEHYVHDVAGAWLLWMETLCCVVRVPGETHPHEPGSLCNCAVRQSTSVSPVHVITAKYYKCSCIVGWSGVWGNGGGRGDGAEERAPRRAMSMSLCCPKRAIHTRRKQNESEKDF